MADIFTYDSLIDSVNEGNIKKLYLFYGSELILINEALSALERKAVKPDFKSLNYSKLDASDIAYDTLVNACETMPFMDERRMVVINNCSLFKSKRQRKEDNFEDTDIDDLCTYIASIPETTVLVFTAGKEIDRKKKIYNTVKKHGCIAEFNFPQGNELLSFVVREFKRLNKIIGKAEISYLISRVPGSLNDILNEIKKISSYIGERGEIKREDIDAVVVNTLEMNVFQLVDSVSLKNPSKALYILNELIIESQPIPVILSMIIRQYRMLLNIKLMTQKGYSNAEISQKLSLNIYVVSGIKKILPNYSEDQIIKRLKRCLDADLAIKTGRMDSRITIEALIVELAG
ncbi:DNA polymerase III subunit delta [Oxobacter pfennigii]|uniref:DNA polymerase III subunit delta n=1 Tax=Oxobacter pfennigii TaxID=36849 RepID=A0A0P8YWN2_9CLOT|nr:DNA polymerase III subunit delta [Oxobacter pfennigii]KPU44133.1 DNA polymerase III subunit delta [Oxobacter pfennigii]